MTCSVMHDLIIHKSSEMWYLFILFDLKRVRRVRIYSHYILGLPNNSRHLLMFLGFY